MFPLICQHFEASWFRSELRSLLFTTFAWLCINFSCLLFWALLLFFSRSTVFCLQPCFALCRSGLPLVQEFLPFCVLMLPFSCFGPLVWDPFVLNRGQTIEVLVRSGWVPRPRTPRTLLCKIWWRILLSCRLTRLDLNSVQFNIPFEDGVLWRLHGRISSFWTSPGHFRRIVGTSKSGVDDASMRTAPGVALWGGKPRRKYFSSLHLTRWTDHFEPKTYFILALYKMITSSAVFLKSPRLRGIFLRDSCPLSHRFKVCSRVNNLRHRHISKTHCVSRACPEPGNVQGTCIGCFLLVTR